MEVQSDPYLRRSKATLVKSRGIPGGLVAGESGANVFALFP